MSAFVLSPGADADLDADFVYGKLQYQLGGYQLRQLTPHTALCAMKAVSACMCVVKSGKIGGWHREEMK